MAHSTGTATKTLRTAIDALTLWEEDRQTLDDILDGPLANHPQRAIVADLLFAYFRNKGLIDGAIDKLATSVNPKIHRVLAATLTQVFFQTGIAPQSAVNVAVDFCRQRHDRKKAGFVNAVARNAIRRFMNGQGKSTLDRHFSNLPPLIRSRWSERFGVKTADELGKLARHRAPLTFELTGDLSNDELEQAGCVPVDAPAWAKRHRFFSCSTPEKLFAQNWIRDGSIYIRDPSTVLAPDLGEPPPNGVRIVDLCAAPGGKTISLAKRFPDAFVTACDVSVKRQRRTAENIANHRLGNAAAVTASATRTPFQEETFNLVLLDVPCSNTGVFRRRPDILWRFSIDSLKKLSRLQRKLLVAAAKLTAPSGFLVYSTCSLESEENEYNVKAFLRQNAHFQLIEEHAPLPSDRHDGCYAVLLRRS